MMTNNKVTFTSKAHIAFCVSVTDCFDTKLFMFPLNVNMARITG